MGLKYLSAPSKQQHFRVDKANILAKCTYALLAFVTVNSFPTLLCKYSIGFFYGMYSKLPDTFYINYAWLLCCIIAMHFILLRSKGLYDFEDEFA